MSGYHVTRLEPCLCPMNQTLELRHIGPLEHEHGHLLKQKVSIQGYISTPPMAATSLIPTGEQLGVRGLRLYGIYIVR